MFLKKMDKNIIIGSLTFIYVCLFVFLFINDQI